MILNHLIIYRHKLIINLMANRAARCDIHFEHFREFTHLTAFTEPSFFLCAGISLFETMSRLVQYKNPIKCLLNKIDSQKAKTFQLGESNSKYIDYYYQIVGLICTSENSKIAFEYIEKFTTNIVGTNYCEVIEFATRCLIASLITEAKQYIIEPIINGSPIPETEIALLLNLIAESFKLHIYLYNDTEQFETFKPMVLGEFPIVYLFKRDSRYCILYNQPFIEVENNLNFSLDILSKKPFVYNEIRRGSGISRQTSQLRIPVDLPSCLKQLVDRFALELIKTKNVSGEIVDLVNNSCRAFPELNEIQNIKALASFTRSTDQIIACAVCKNIIDYSAFSQFSCSSRCKICISCRTSDRVKCIGCKNQYTASERKILG